MTELNKSVYATNGVTISPPLPSTRSNVKITYNGLLVHQGAREVFAHVGFGQEWQKTSDYKMSRTLNGFEVSISIPEYTNSINVCFRDSINNWDNNSGANYSFMVRPPNSNYSLDYEHEVYLSKKQ